MGAGRPPPERDYFDFSAADPATLLGADGRAVADGGIVDTWVQRNPYMDPSSNLRGPGSALGGAITGPTYSATRRALRFDGTRMLYVPHPASGTQPRPVRVVGFTWYFVWAVAEGQERPFLGVNADRFLYLAGSGNLPRFWIRLGRTGP